MTVTNEQIQALKDRYSEPETPNCRICGAKMSIQRASAGSLVYGCDGRVEGDGYAFKEGRDFADKHYEQSRETVHNTGDADVIALLAERDADKALIAESVVLFETMRQRIAELEARTLTVKLPERATADKYVDGTFDNSDLAAIYNTCRLECEVKIKNACAAAGITLDVGE